MSNVDDTYLDFLLDDYTIYQTCKKDEIFTI